MTLSFGDVQGTESDCILCPVISGPQGSIFELAADDQPLEANVQVII